METNFNLGSLKIVQVPLMEHFTKAQESIENSISSIRDEKKIPNDFESVAILNKVQKTLKMIGLVGVASVVAIVEEALSAVKDVRFDSKKNLEILESSFKIVKNVSFYVKGLVNFGVDQPTKFFDDYSALAKLLEKQVSIKDLFYPKLEFHSSFSEVIQNDLRVGAIINDNSKKNLVSHIEKAHASIRTHFVDVFKVLESNGKFSSEEEKASYQVVCKKLYEAFDYLQKLKISKNFYILFGLHKLYVCVLSPVFNGGFSDYVSSSKNEIKLNLAKTERIVSRLLQAVKDMDNGEKTGTLRPDDETVKEIVFDLIGIVGKNANLREMPVFKDLSAYFDFSFYEKQLSETQININVELQNKETVQKIESLFAELKEDLGLLDSKKAVSQDAFSEQLKKSVVAASKLLSSVSSVEEIKPLLMKVEYALMLAKENKIDFSNALEREISLGMVLIEYGINNFIKNSIDDKFKTEFLKQSEVQVKRLSVVMDGDLDALAKIELPKLDSASQKSDERKSLVKIFTKISLDLTKTEEVLDYYLRNNGENASEIEPFLRGLMSSKGIFSMIGKRELIPVVEKIVSVWTEIVKNGQDSVSEDDRNVSIALVSGLSLLVKAYEADNDVEADELFENILRIFGKDKEAEVVEESFGSLIENVPSIMEVEVPVVEQVSQAPIIETVVEVPMIKTEDIQPVVQTEVKPVEIKLDLEEKSVESKSSKVYSETTNDPDLAEVFLMEAEEVLENMEVSLGKLESDISNKEELTCVRRYFHTLKGSGRMVGLEYLGEAAWMVEQTLNRVLQGDGGIVFDNNLFETIKVMKGRFDGWIKELKDTNNVVVDLVYVKKTFLEINPHITNHVEIDLSEDTSFVEVELVEEVQPIVELVEEVVEEVPVAEVSLDGIGFEVDSTTDVDSEIEFSTDISIDEPVSEDAVESLNELSVDEGTGAIDFNFELESVADVEEALSEQSSVVEETVVDLSDEKVDSDSETILINGKEVSSSLYALFDEESVEHISGMKSFVAQNYVDGVVISEDFMRHAHTLSSIAKTVNLNKVAQIASKIELISLAAIEKDLVLSLQDMMVIRQAVDNIEIFKNFNDSLNQSYFDSIFDSISVLYADVTERNNQSLEEPVVEAVQQGEDVVFEVEKNVSAIARDEIESMLEKLSLSIQEKVEQRLSFINDGISSLEGDLNNVKNAVGVQEQVDIKEVSRNVIGDVLQIVEKEFMKFSDVTRKEREESEKVIAELNSRVAQIEQTYEERDKRLDKNIDVMRQDIRNIASVLKKKDKPEICLGENYCQADGEVNLEGQLVLLEKELFVESVDNSVEVEPVVLMDVADAQVSVMESDLEQGEVVVVPVEEEVVQLDSVNLENSDDVGLVVLSTDEIVEKEALGSGVLVENFVQEENQFEGEVNQDVVAVDATVGVDAFDNIFEAILKENKIDVDNVGVDNDILSNVQDISDSEIEMFLNDHEHVKSIFEERISVVEDEIDLDIYEISKPEADEMMEKIVPLIEDTDLGGLPLETVKELKRYLHTLKGSVRMAGANKIGMLAHRLESLIDYIETRNINIYAAKPLLEREMEKIGFLLKDPTVAVDTKTASWLDLVFDESDKKVSASIVEQVTELKNVVRNDDKLSAKKEGKQFIRLQADVIDEVINEAGEIRLTRTTLEDVTQNNRKSLQDLLASSSKLVKMLREVEVQAETQIQARQDQVQETGVNFDPLEFDRFTRLQELTRFMNEAVADINDTVLSFEKSIKLQDNTIVQQSIMTNNLLSSLMSVRLVPMDSISESLYQITRKTSKELGKKVVLELVGEKTEMDRLVLDKIKSPMEHLLRNSIAHGIEAEEDRVKKGKSMVGKITIYTSLDGNSIIIKLGDDGAGINVEKVKKIGLSKGLIDASREYSQEEIVNLIFQSGFSTADSVSQVAGRGVGMDVVKSEINALGGTVKIETVKDKGSTFILTLPMSVATNQTMLCEAQGKLLAIPALLVDEVDSFKKEVIDEAYNTRKIKIKGQEFDFVYAGHLLGLTNFNRIPEIKTYNSVIKVRYLNQTIVVHVDKLITTTEILIKPIGSIFSKISGILGATLLGDGRQGIIINPVLLKKHCELVVIPDEINKSESSQDKKNTTTTVMVVDDSNTVRRATSKFLERAGFNVILGKDGEDGLEQLQVAIPDIILSDIEMPRMDGFEFVKNIRNIDKYSNIPIIMITSRTAEKHKNHAFELGANDFLGKPFREDELIEKINILIKK